MYPPTIAREAPNRPAYIMTGSGEQLTYGELDAQSNQLAHLLRERGVKAADSLVIYLPNHISWPVAVAAGMRTGLLVTPVNWHLGPDELAPILSSAEPAVIVTCRELAPTILSALPPDHHCLVLSVDGAADGASALAEMTADQPITPVSDELLGARVLFSGGTTGSPKAYRHPLLGVHPLKAPARHPGLADALGIGPGIRFLSPAPSYHAAPFTFQLMTLAVGGTVVCMEKFDAAAALRALVDHEVTHSQWVPTMLTRLLALPDRDAVPLSPTHRVAMTSGAPCPAALKDAINDWWGDILHEYYGASEGYGHTYISPQESRSHRGSVGRPLGSARVRILGADDNELPAGEVGRVCFEQPAPKAGVVPQLKGMGDMGRLDGDGFLYLTGRATFMIISGGVNIYPEEIEEALSSHSGVRDAAVFGAPDPDFGESVMAVVELDRSRIPDDAAAVLDAHCRSVLASYKVPRRWAFVESMPRLPTGKLNKTALRAQHLGPIRH